MRFKQVLRAGIRVIGTNIRFLGGKMVHGKHLKYSLITCLAFSDEIALSKNSRLEIGKHFRTRGRCRINVQEEGHLIIGEDVFFNTGCQINSRSKIVVGSGCEFGPNVLIYDHDHDFRDKGGIKGNEYKYGDITIGSYCWIGAGSVLLRGTTLGDGCVVGAGSVLKGSFPEGSVIVQKRETTVTGIDKTYWTPS